MDHTHVPNIEDLEAQGVDADGGYDGEVEAEEDPRLGTFTHPTKGEFATYLFSNERNTRLFFEEEEGTWVRMPLAWERDVPDVQVRGCSTRV